MSRSIGIDLGTTNSVIAAIIDGQPKVIPNEFGEILTPSLVLLKREKRQFFVGHHAKNHVDRYSADNLTISSVKRMMGHMSEICWGDNRYYPQVVSALILAELKLQAERHLGEKIDEAVISIPSNFGEKQRQATKEAAEIAGIKVLRILNEATASAIAYGINKTEENQYLVYDLGGGTLDISLLEVWFDKEGGQGFEIRMIEGIEKFGGDDFDSLIIDYIATKVKDGLGVDPREDHISKMRIKETSEQTKITLSSQESVKIHIPYMRSIRNRLYDIDLTITRKTFEDLSKDLIDKAIKPVKNVLLKKEWHNISEKRYLETPPKQTKQNLAGKLLGKIKKAYKVEPKREYVHYPVMPILILAGGASRIPALKQRLVELVNANVCTREKECVALGAVIQADIIKGNRSNVTLLDVTPRNVGIEIKDGKCEKIILKDTTIPATKSKIYTTTVDNQDSIYINVLEGENELALSNVSLGRIQIKGVPLAKAGVPQIEVTFSIDRNNILQVTAQDKGTGQSEQLIAQYEDRLSQREIDMIKNWVQEWIELRKFEGR